MTTERAPRRKVAPSHPGTIFVLVLAAWVHPALSATGADTLCDQSVGAQPVAAVADTRLTIQVIDHGANTAVTPDDISLEETPVDFAPESSDSAARPRIDVMLGRIFDESQLRQRRLPEPEPPDDLGGTLAVDKSEGGEEPAAVIDTDQADHAAELPGFSADELLRYRRQMLRKDI